MATQKFQVEELDQESRDYLLAIRDSKGDGMPGAYVPQSNNLAGCGCLCGILVLGGTLAIASNQMTKEPLAVAMLQTAGILLGGWLIIYAIRVWMFKKGRGFAGNFIYADAQTLWECRGSSVTVTDLSELVEARQTKNYNNDKYQNTAIEVSTADGTRKFTINNESGASQIVIFLNLVAWLRSGGKEDVGIPMPADVQAGVDKMPAAIMGGVALDIYESNVFPADLSPQALKISVDSVPTPKKEGRASSSILWYLLIVGVAVGGVFLLKEMNIPLRDAAIWKHILDIPQPEKKAPWIRAYLNDSRNTQHRDEAKQLLANIYKDSIARIKSQNIGPDKPHPELLGGLEQILLELPNQPLPLITIRATEKGANAETSKERAKSVQNAYTRAILDAVGEELIIFAEAPGEAPAMLEIEYTPIRAGNGGQEINYSVKFRRTADAELAKTVTHTLTQTISLADTAQRLGVLTAGKKKPAPPLIVMD